MIIMQVQDVSRYFGGDKLFDHISFDIKSNDRIALVGRNGAGKSTLLKMLAGVEAPDSGHIQLGKYVSVGYLAQRTGYISDKTIWDEMLTTFSDVLDIEKDLQAVALKLSDETVLADEATYNDYLKQYDNLQTRFSNKGGYTYESDIKAVLGGFGYFEDDYDTHINELSGGQKTRVALAKLLLEKPDLLILDEPTNHLDVDTLVWLEGYLKGYTGALLIVSHDRYFMDQLVDEVYDLNYGVLEHYVGNYSHYLQERESRYAQQLQRYEKQQKEIKEMEDFIDKNIVRASTTKRAQSRRKQLEKLDRIEKPTRDEQTAKFRFEAKRNSGDMVLRVKDLTIGYDGIPTATAINFEERKGENIAIVGPNGIGKSTLLKTIIGQLEAITGEITLGSKVDIGYYDQEQQNLHMTKSILNELWDDYPLLNEETIRTLLGSFLFTGEDVKKHIVSLSGGEKARVALAKLTLRHDNFLILDEPTNHLDIDSKEILEDALRNFEGTVLFVSHDRYFINRVADKVVEITPEKSLLYLGDYDYYLEKKAELEELAQLKALEESEKAAKEPTIEKDKAPQLDREEQKEWQKRQRQLSRQVNAIEDQLATFDEAIGQIEHQLTLPDVYNNPEKSLPLSEELSEKKSKQDKLMAEWEQKLSELDQM